ncbi:uncharacterized protein C4orf54 homolog [Rhinichthys klamathensis goyatoka]|uniref:uncharacterized protein C4orf54 homolog n=1 Tax=Rhinichthys klamathensis goyatoka TaxID=3034132 RepID=UPI0024B4B573|nr:uncharacterized protein C4orf54 homolog [Rhinichthys klamathensis goyatoka]
MAASEKTLIYREDTDSYKNLLYKRDMRLISAQEESNYVDLNDLLELKLDDTKTVKVTFTGDSSPLEIIKSISGMSDSKGEHEPPTGKIRESTQNKCALEECGEKSNSFETATSETPQADKTDCIEKTEQKPKSPNLETQSIGNDNNEQYNEVYLSSKSESDDEVTVVLSDHDTREDESHYITTHEIELLELDHDVDYDFETGSSWELEDDLQVYSFVDYASFDSDETMGAKEACVKSNQANTSGAVVSSEPESNLCDADKCASSDEGLSKKQNTTGQIHLSIKATSRAVNELRNIQDHEKDKSRYVLRGVDAKGDKACDNAKCFIAVPGRLHFGSKLKSKDVNEYSSGASSAVSELDDADKEVRNLTARAFKSLAYPYFNAINFSTSSESSASEHGLGINSWSTFVDLKYGKGRDQNLVPHKGSTPKFHFAKKRDGKGITGLTLTSMRAPPVEIFALNGNLVGHKNASSTTKKIELMGKFSQGQSGLIRLTETLNFRCNVKSGQSVNESAGGSRSTDEVTHTLPSAQGSEASKRSCNAGETMEDTHKKSVFASSLLKNVISKKMQFEQERKMERGEICEAHHAPSPCFAMHEHEKAAKKNSKGLQRQSSKFSEADSDFTIVSVDDLGDIVDGNSSDAKDDGRNEETLTSASETNLESANDTKKGAFEASKSTLLRSQNSAFRSWRDGELEFQKEHKNVKTLEGKPLRECPGETNFCVDSASGKPTKMSHLFVPSIQLPSSERDLRKPPPKVSYSTRNRGESGALKWRSNTLYVTDATRSAVTSKSPEIKISLRSVRDNKSDPFNIAKLLTPNLGCKTAEDTRCQALATAFKGESSDKVPHFIVRDIRENKGKLQTPIHQVRDVRKLVKSSYHFVSLDNNDNKSSYSTSDGEQKALKQSPYLNSASLSPIVIKCQSVNTNSNVKQSGDLIDPPKRRFPEDIVEADRSSPHVAVANRLPKQEVPTGLKIETSTRKQDKTSDASEKKTEPKMANQAALEKLQAAVKTMEQLYVFDKNEWKRKKEPRPITDSHVLSLISGEKHTVEELESYSPAVSLQRRDSNSNLIETPPKKDDKSSSATQERNGPKALTGTPCKDITKKPVTSKTPQTHVASPASLSFKALTPKSPKLPISLKISHPKRVLEERERSNGSETEFAPLQFTSTADSESYLTIPVKPHATSAAGLGKSAVYAIPPGGGKTQTASPPSYLAHSDIRSHPSPKRSSFVMETRSSDTPTATIYHTPMPVTMQAAQPQLICFSPSVQPSPVPTDHFHTTQRKMLLDPTTGSYYLVDTPVQPATRRLFDPETGQYVDVSMPQQPPMTPVPLPISPLALGPGAYGHTYMFYPGYMPTTMIPARTIQSQLSMQSEADDGDKSHPDMGQQEERAYMESPYYMPLGKSSQTVHVAQHVPTTSKQPVISITSQQGPRIIAPPSFDGTTMSFVVEHR